MSRNPFKGIYAEIARELQISRQAVRHAAMKRNPRILALVNQKVEERRRIVSEFEETCGSR